MRKITIFLIVFAFVSSSFIVFIGTEDSEALIFDPDWGDEYFSLMISDADGSKSNSEMVLTSDGGSIVVWQQWPESDLWAQKMSKDGEFMWQENGIRVHLSSMYDEEGVQIISDGDGGAIISWQVEDTYYDQHEVRIQRIDKNGQRLWDDIGEDVDDTAFNITEHQLISDGQGGAIVCWQYDSLGTGADYDIRAQRFDPDGNKLWGASAFAICTTSDDQEGPAMCSDGNGGAIIAWEDDRSGNDIYGERVSADGQRLWSPS